MVAGITSNPVQTTFASGTFAVNSDGYIQGQTQNDPNVRNQLQGGIAAASNLVPIFGGQLISASLPTVASGAAESLGFSIAPATLLGTTGAAGSATGFAVFDQAHGMLSNPQSPVPQAAPGMGVNFYNFGSNARLAVAASPNLAAYEGGAVTQQVSWDFVAQRLVPYEPTFAPATITAAAWANTNGGQCTFTVSSNLTTDLSAGDTIEVSGVAPAAYNGAWYVLSVTATQVVVSMPYASAPAAYTSGGTVASGSGPLPVKVLRLNFGNSMTVNYSSATGFATWNYGDNCALIQLISPTA